jgi:hypothetical protein
VGFFCHTILEVRVKLTTPAPWGWESQPFKPGGVHNGIDWGWFNRDPAGTRRVVAAAPGRVIEVANNAGFNRGWGNRVAIAHTTRAFTTYNHAPNNGIRVSVGQIVDASTQVQVMGDTGTANGIHLHFELYIDGNRVDPRPYFTQDLPGVSVIAAPPAPTPALGVRDRLTGVNGANGRTVPQAGGTATLAFRNTAVTMQAFTTAGASVEGNRLWFQGVNGLWYWSGGFTSQSVLGLTDATPVPFVPTPPAVVSPPVVVSPPEVQPPVVEPDPPAPPVIPEPVEPPTEPEPVTPILVPVEVPTKLETPTETAQGDETPAGKPNPAAIIIAALVALLAALLAFFQQGPPA